MTAPIFSAAMSSNITWNKLYLSRRSLLSLLSSVPVFVTSPNDVTAKEDNYRTTLEALIDTLLPAHESAPSGVKLGILDDIQRLGVEIENYAQMLQLGCNWLNFRATKISGEGFTDATSKTRDSVLKNAFEEPENSLPKVFAARVRKDCMIFYYSNPIAWRGLPLNEPIQPVGFPDHWRPA